MKKSKGKKALKIIGRILSVIICVCLAAIIILNISLFASKTLGKNHQLKIFGLYPLVVKSDSMSPFFNKGDLIFSRQAGADDVTEGDVVSFINVHAEEEEIVTHRIKRVIQTGGERFFITKGDGNPSNDFYELSGTNVIGKYVGKIPYIGYLIMFIQKPIGLILCLGSILLLFISFSIYSHFKEKDKKRYKPGYDGSI